MLLITSFISWKVRRDWTEVALKANARSTGGFLCVSKNVVKIIVSSVIIEIKQLLSQLTNLKSLENIFSVDCEYSNFGDGDGDGGTGEIHEISRTRSARGAPKISIFHL